MGKAKMAAKVQFRIRVYQGENIAIGPGKVALLEALAATGSISAAARELGMSYRRAWLLIDETNRSLASPAVTASAGGAHGGGATLTALGLDLITRYREIETISHAAARTQITALSKLFSGRD